MHPRPQPARIRPSSLLLAIPLALYFALTLPQLSLPGLHNDEAVEAGLPAEQILSGQPIRAFRDAGPSIGGRTFPLMVQDYIGAFNVYFVLPFFALLGPTPAALRVYTVVVGAITVALTFGFLASTLSPRGALIGASLLAVSPSFVFWQRQGAFVTSLTAAFAAAVLWAGAGWSRKGGWQRAALLGLLCGAGLYAKLLFIWILGGLAGALVLINLPILVRHLISRTFHEPDGRHEASNFQSLTANRQPPASHLQLFPRTPSASDLLAFTLASLLALLPLVAYNLQTGGTLLSIGTNLTTSYYGVNNLDFFSNLSARVDHFRAVIAGRDHLWYLGGSFGNGTWESALNLAGLVILGRWLFRRQRSRLPAALLWLLVLGILQSSFTVSGLFPTHLSVFTPLWPMLVAFASETVLNPFYEPLFIHLSGPNLSSLLGSLVRGWMGFLNVGMLVVLVGLGGLLAGDLVVTLRYHAVLNRSGGHGPHADAVYRLADYLQDPALEGAPVVAMDWGFAPQVEMLTRGRVQPEEIFGYTWEPDPGFADRLEAALDRPGAIFVFHFEQETIFPRREQFEARVRERGWTAEQMRVVSRRDGAPVFEVVRVVKTP
jgi:hypothetical protein